MMTVYRVLSIIWLAAIIGYKIHLDRLWELSTLLYVIAAALFLMWELSQVKKRRWL